jgi:hypothetical protein
MASMTMASARSPSASVIAARAEGTLDPTFLGSAR